MFRRQVLTSFTFGLTASVAGCLEDGGGIENDDADDTTPDGGETDDHGDDGNGEPISVEYEVIPFAVSLVRPDWADDPPKGPNGHLELFDSADAARETLDFDAVDEDERDDVEAFVDDTNFSTGRLLFIASIGPRTTAREIEFDGVEQRGSTVEGTATVREVGDIGGEAITYPSILVRIVSDHPPDAAKITVVDGWSDAETHDTTIDSE